MSKRPTKKPTKNIAQNPLFNKLLKNHTPEPPPLNDWKAELHIVVYMWKQGDSQHALQRCEKLANQTQYAHNDINNVYAILLCENQRFAEGIDMWKRIPNWQNQASLLSNMGRAYQIMGELKQAHQYLSQALQLEPNHLDGLLNMGVTLQKLDRRQESAEYYQKVLAIKPDYELAKFNLATLCQDELDFQTAYQHYQDILQNNPSYANALANLVFTQHYIVPYQPEVIDERVRRLGQLFVAQAKPNQPITLSPEMADKPLHIGLVSADLQTHPVGFFIESLLTSQAATQLKWSAYANSPVFDSLSARLKPVFQNWHHVNTWSDARLIEQIRSDGVDILIDLSGLTRGNRMAVFAAQAAPVQINWLGYFGTTGLPTMQAVIADPYCVPESEEHWFVERVWRMQHSRLCLSVPTENVSVNPLPALNKGYITFGCFQNLAKINDEVLSVWGENCSQAA